MPPAPPSPAGTAPPSSARRSGSGGRDHLQPFALRRAALTLVVAHEREGLVASDHVAGYERSRQVHGIRSPDLLPLYNVRSEGHTPACR